VEGRQGGHHRKGAVRELCVALPQLGGTQRAHTRPKPPPRPSNHAHAGQAFKPATLADAIDSAMFLTKVRARVCGVYVERLLAVPTWGR